jgi:hypothetical protein
MSLEQLRTIKGYDNYMVSSWGKVYATRVVWKATQLIDNSAEVFYPDSVRQELKPEETSKGYLRVDLYDKNGNRKHFKIHRLVAQAFIPNPENKPQINHIDGNKHNNSITNLEWVTDAENKEHRKKLSENV